LVPRLAAKTVVGPKLGAFVRAYPDVVLDITTDDSHVDLVAAGYDAGIQFGEYIAQDMIAVRVRTSGRPSLRHPTTFARMEGPRCLATCCGTAASISGTGARASIAGSSTEETSPWRWP
jgi:DNA-binding transcriptional LysR family regulator